MKASLPVLAVMTALTTFSAVPAIAQPAFPPPPPEVGGPPPPPGPPERFILEPGHWHWNGFRYRWIRRHWVPTRPGWVHFIPGHWGYGRWVPAHWGP